MVTTVTMSGGDGLRRTLERIEKSLATASELDVGFLSGPSYPDGTPVAQVAADNEFGNPARGVPPRPFFRNMVDSRKNEIAPELAIELKKTDLDMAPALDATGMTMEGWLRQSIMATNAPPNSPATIARKGSSKPLVDTGLMIGSISHEVR